MRVDRNVILSILVAVSLPKKSKQKVAKNCPDQQFWSTFFNSKGSCAKCPPFYKNCGDQGSQADIDSCKDSCRVKPTLPAFSTPILSSTPITPTSSYIPPGHTEVRPNASIPVSYPSSVRSDDPRKSKISMHFDITQHVWLIGILIAILAVLAILALVALVVVLVRTTSAGNRDGTVDVKNAEEGVALQDFQVDEGEGRLHEANDGEEGFHEPDDGDRPQPNDAEERFHEPDDEDRPQANDEEERVQELEQPPVQATPSSERVIQGIQEESKVKGLSLVDLDEIYT